MYYKHREYYAWWVYQALCGPNGWLLQGDIKANIRKEHSFDQNDREYFQHFSGQDFLDPCSLRCMEGEKLKMFYQEVGKHFRKRGAMTKRLQFDVVKILKKLKRQGFSMLDIVNQYHDITYRKKQYQVLLRKENVFLLLEDDFTDKGSTLKLYAGVWTPMLLSAKREKSLKLIYSIPHRRENEKSYLIRICDAVGVFLKSIN